MAGEQKPFDPGEPLVNLTWQKIVIGLMALSGTAWLLWHIVAR